MWLCAASHSIFTDEQFSRLSCEVGTTLSTSSSWIRRRASSALDLGRALAEVPPSLRTSLRRPTEPAVEPATALSSSVWATASRASASSRLSLAVSSLALASCTRF